MIDAVTPPADSATKSSSSKLDVSNEANDVKLTPALTVVAASDPEEQPKGYFEVADVLNIKKKGKGYIYQVVWKGYTGADAVSWVPGKNLNFSEDYLRELHQKFGV